MEQILLELSAQNEHARAEASPRPADPTPATPEAPRARTVRVERDSEFRTPEGVPSARAYLPARTLAPGRTEPIDTETVRVSDPRRLPTVRLPRDRNNTPAAEGSGRKPRAASEGQARASSSRARAGAKDRDATPIAGGSRSGALDDNAPTLRSASPLAAEMRAPETRRWIGWVVLAAIAGVLIVALAARFRSSPARPPVPSPSQTAISQGGSAPPVRESVLQELPSPTAGPPKTGDAAPTTAPSQEPTQDPSARPRSAPKSDRWF